MKQDHWAVKVWNIIYPIAMYYVTITITIFCAQLFLGTGNKSYMLCKVIGSAVTIPVLFSYYKTDLIFEGVYGEKIKISKEELKELVGMLVAMGFVSVSLNNLILMSPLYDLSKNYGEASNTLYGGSFFVEFIGAVVLIPILEELLHRGIVYKRVRRMVGVKLAIVISAFLFAILHFNLVQAVYAFFIGIILALFVEKIGHLYGAILGHMTANFIAIIRTETGCLNGLLDKSLLAWLISILLLAIGVILLFLSLKNKFCNKGNEANIR